MKCQLTLVFAIASFFLFTPLQSEAQAYYGFGGDEYAGWLVKKRKMDTDGSVYWSDTYTLENDTVVIDSLQYRTLLRDGAVNLYIRDEGNVVYARLPNNSNIHSSEPGEFILYDYNLQVGDTFWLPHHNFYPNDTLGVVVTQVYYIELHDGSMREQWFFTPTTLDPTIYNPWGPNYNEDFSWVRTVGCTEGPHYLELDGGLVRSYLYCYWQDDALADSLYGPCGPITSIEEAEQALQFKVSPNPTSGALSIEVPSNVDANYFQFRLLDITGQEVQTGTWKRDEQLVLNEHPEGIYFLQLAINDRWFSTKIQVSH